MVHQLVGKDDVNIGRQDEASAGAPDAHVLRDHLEKRQPVSVLEAVVQHGWHRNHAALAVSGLGRQLQHAGQPRAPHHGIPVHQNQLGGQAVLFALPGKQVDEDLGADQRIAPVIVIARGGDDGEVGCLAGVRGCHRSKKTCLRAGWM